MGGWHRTGVEVTSPNETPRAGGESGQALGQAAQGSGGVPIPGGVQTPSGCGTWGHGLAAMVVLGWQLGLMTLDVFSNLNDSMSQQKARWTAEQHPRHAGTPTEQKFKKKKPRHR